MVWTASLLALGSPPANPISLGILTHAERARIGETVASEGSTVYEGDRLSTESGGLLRVNSPALQLQLDAQSTLTLRQTASPQADVVAELASGTLVFSVSSNGNFHVAADDATIRPMTNVPAVGHVRVVNPRELRIYAQRGALEFSYRGESEAIPEGAAYRVILDPDTPATSASEPDHDGKKPTKNHATFVLSAIGIAGGVGIPLLAHEFESPDKPGRHHHKQH